MIAPFRTAATTLLYQLVEKPSRSHVFIIVQHLRRFDLSADAAVIHAVQTILMARVYVITDGGAPLWRFPQKKRVGGGQGRDSSLRPSSDKTLLPNRPLKL
jgi:hypothetical protein